MFATHRPRGFSRNGQTWHPRDGKRGLFSSAMTCWICYVDMTVSSEIHTLTGQHSFLASYAKELHKVDPSFPEELHCHVFRHSIGMAMFKAGIPLPYIKDFLGHSSIDSRYICSWIGKGGDTPKLGDDHSVYRIYVSYYDNPGNNFISQGNNFTNLGASYKWTISNAKNCSIS